MFLHGWGGRADATIATPEIVEPLLAAGWAAIAPQGVPRRPGEAGGRWNSRASADTRDDVAFLNAVAEDAAARAGLARDRMILAGFSGGGMMAWRQACDAPESFRAYVPVAGLLWRPLPEDCAGPVRMLHLHGWSDPVVPIEGRAVAGGRLVQGDLFAGLDLMRRANGCGRDDPDVYGAEGAFLLRAWSEGCDPASALAFALFPGGHRVPEGWAALALDWEAALPPAAAPR
jgi:polyhydroxybutyrate depolymerase